MKNLNVVVYNDPGHGWGRVSHTMIKELGIEKEISPYSFMTVKYVYLEEDMDLNTFGKACDGKYKIIFNEKHTDGQASCRGYSNYDAEHLGYVVGSVLEHWQGGEMTIEKFEKGSIIVEFNGRLAKIKANNFTSYLA